MEWYHDKQVILDYMEVTGKSQQGVIEMICEECGVKFTEKDLV